MPGTKDDQGWRELNEGWGGCSLQAKYVQRPMRKIGIVLTHALLACGDCARVRPSCALGFVFFAGTA